MMAKKARIYRATSSRSFPLMPASAPSDEQPLPQRGVALLALTWIALKYSIPKPFQNPQTLGQHLRARRHELSLYLREEAISLGVTPSTLTTWEKVHTTPEIWYWPAILNFLGYDPYPEPKSLGDQLHRRYRQLGLSRNAASRQLGIDAGTLRRYEDGIWTPTVPRSKRLIAGFLAQ